MDQLKKIICNYVDASPTSLSDDMSLNAELGLDSFALISMLLEIEESFGVEIPNHVLPNFQTLNDLYSYIEENSTASV